MTPAPAEAGRSIRNVMGYKDMKKLLYRLATSVRKMYWFIFRPTTLGVKVVVIHGEKVLMIKNTYGKDVWTFPVGGVIRNESPESAAKRDVLEEVGIGVSSVRMLGEFISALEYKKDTIKCYSASIDNPVIVIDGDEVKEARWFDKTALPHDMSSIAQKVMMLCIASEPK
jgi:ADP-ribose pyrophosphatase YjhB (NUDIX family)